MTALRFEREGEDASTAPEPVRTAYGRRKRLRRSALQRRQAVRAASVRRAAESRREARFLWRHRRGLLMAVGFLASLALLMGCMASCSLLVEGGLAVLSGTTYPCRDGDMLEAEAAYSGMEDQLRAEIAGYEELHPEFDEFVYEVDSIGHDPYVLISLLTAYYRGEWQFDEDLEDTLSMLFSSQYTFSTESTVETRYRTESRTGTRTVTDPVTGEPVTEEYEYTVEVPYEYHICTVSLENFDLSHLPMYLLSEEQVGRYAGYMAVRGNRPDLFSSGEYPNVPPVREPVRYEIPPEALEDETFARMVAEGEKYLGWAYVWCGSSPDTSFDCSGYVSWILNHSGWDVGRQSAQGLYNLCTPVSPGNARPGDLVFFTGTYDTPGVSHCGLYVGDGMMLNAGDPIGYANVNSSYWQQFFYCYARLPEP